MLGIREIRRRKTTFALIAAIVALISYLVIMVNGLGLGLREGFGGALGNFDANAIAFGAESRLSVFRSEMSQETVEAIGRVEGVEQFAPVGYLAVDYRDSEDVVESAAFFGFDPGTIAEPQVTGGRALSREDDRGLLVDERFIEESGLRIGDPVTVIYRLREEEFTIVGTVNEGMFEFGPAVYLLRESWQELRYGDVDTGALPAASIVILQGNGLEGVSGPGFEIVSKEEAFSSVEGLSEIDATIWGMRIAAYLIGAAVIGAFYYVLTLQKIPNIGLLKALGASNRFVVGQTLLQVVAIMAAGTVASVLAAILTNEALFERSDETIPIIVTTGSYLTTTVSLAITAILAVLLSVRSILRVDPIIALAQQQ